MRQDADEPIDAREALVPRSRGKATAAVVRAELVLHRHNGVDPASARQTVCEGVGLRRRSM